MPREEEVDAGDRTTAPQGPYTMRKVGIGFLIFFLLMVMLVVLALSV